MGQKSESVEIEQRAEKRRVPDDAVLVSHQIGGAHGAKGDEKLADDLLYGAQAIADYIGRDPRWVYYQQKALGLTHVGALLVGSKSKIRKLLTGEAA
jgi:hypothetical protein